MSGTPDEVHLTVSQVKQKVDDDTTLFTIMRDPYDRSCSEYYFIVDRVIPKIEVKFGKLANSKKTDVLIHRISQKTNTPAFAKKIKAIVEEEMLVEDYLVWSANNPTYPIYYDDIGPGDFDLIGITENMNGTLSILKSHGINAGGDNYRNNIKKNIGDSYTTKISRKDFENMNNIEYQMYYEGLEKYHSLL